MPITVFETLAIESTVIPVVRRLMSDHLSPVLAYRRLVASDDRTAPSFLFESVENGNEVGRFSFLGANPSLEIISYQNEVTILDHETGSKETRTSNNPLELVRELSKSWNAASPITSDDLPLPSFTGGWVGFTGYDSARFCEIDSLPFSKSPKDDRDLPDIHLALYKTVVIFDHVAKVVHVIYNATPDKEEVADEWERANDCLDEVVGLLLKDGENIPVGTIDLDLGTPPSKPTNSNMSKDEFEKAVIQCQDYIAAGDAFQIVISQRFEHRSKVDPFEIYRALRVVNPSPYMIYLQTEECILVASSPEILCRCRGGLVTNRPLAGTRRRGKSTEEDQKMVDELLSDDKEKSEHVMLVDLGRNDLGTVCELGTVEIKSVMDIERYSHVMHLSSTVVGQLADGKDSWDALSATLPVGTVSGAPKIRAMQIIDELEPTRRGPYAGGIGMIGFNGDMDMAIALRTMVIPTSKRNKDGWRIDIQAGAGVVIDSIPELEWKETVNKAAGLGRAIELAESTFRC
ncbi:MAG: anthranilate synthase component I [Phycisphaerales bacterium]|jgi:anthranilate synthase component 1|nr:anthranilate synthase component I [Phycisphaerales bacterium]